MQFGPERNFDKWLSTFCESIASYDYYVDFDKVVKNASQYRDEFCALDSLIGSEDPRSKFVTLVNKMPSIMKSIPILVAIRDSEVKVVDDGELYRFNFDKPNYSVEQYADFMERIGLFSMFSNHLISSVYDYATGVEVGLDSNGRKNRGGHLMEDLVESYLKKEKLEYSKECYIGNLEMEYEMDLSPISNNGKMEKRFDFVVYGGEQVYAMEVNFYKSSGSKLNETARSYKTLALESREIDRFNFVWVTDGKGWESARNNLRETFDVMEHLYCINDLKQSGFRNLLFR